jgi:hypothetical protein
MVFSFNVRNIAQILSPPTEKICWKLVFPNIKIYFKFSFSLILPFLLILIFKATKRIKNLSVPCFIYHVYISVDWSLKKTKQNQNTKEVKHTVAYRVNNHCQN